jgi:hypothetical protein
MKTKLNVRVRVDSNYTARHDTTKTSVHSHLPSVNKQAKYSLLSILTTLSLSLAFGDGQM